MGIEIEEMYRRTVDETLIDGRGGEGRERAIRFRTVVVRWHEEGEVFNYVTYPPAISIILLLIPLNLNSKFIMPKSP